MVKNKINNHARVQFYTNILTHEFIYIYIYIYIKMSWSMKRFAFFRIYLFCSITHNKIGQTTTHTTPEKTK